MLTTICYKVRQKFTPFFGFCPAMACRENYRSRKVQTIRSARTYYRFARAPFRLPLLMAPGSLFKNNRPINAVMKHAGRSRRRKADSRCWRFFSQQEVRLNKSSARWFDVDLFDRLILNWDQRTEIFVTIVDSKFRDCIVSVEA